MASGVGSHAGAQLQSSMPLAVSTPGTIGTSCLNEVVSQQNPPVVSTSQDTDVIAADQGNLLSETHTSNVNENSELMEVSKSKLPDLNEQSSVAECDNNTSSEDDSLLMCSETIDSGCSITEAPSALEFFTSLAESTPVKDPAELGGDQIPQTMSQSTREHETVSVLDPLSLQDIEVSVSDSNTENESQKGLISDTKLGENQPEIVVDCTENVTVQRLDVAGEISDIVGGGLSEHIYSEPLVTAGHDEEKPHNSDVDSEDLCSSLESAHCDDQNLVVKGDEDGSAVENAGLPVENALQIIESFVESMEANRGGKSEETKLSSNDLPPGLLPSSISESAALPEVIISDKGNEFSEQITFETETDKNPGEGQSSNILPRFEEDCWDVSDTPIDVLSTSTSSSNSASESTELTEKEIKALEAIGNIRTSGRKRKPPTSLDVSPPRQVSGWVRGALSLLQKVASYRGQGRRKGDFGAASWFLKPVDPVDAPGYYKVIKNPMDFGTIRAKLESSKYQEYTEFHADMMLVKTNCLKYNPPGHDVRQDCEEVFKFYETEYAKMLERWEKCHVSPAKKPRVASKSESST